MIAAKRIPGLSVMCVEPDPRLALLITENFRQNRLPPPTVMNAIAGERASQNSTFSINSRSSLDNRVYNPTWKKILVPTIAMSNHLQKIEKTEKVFIKIDTQGYEPYVLKGLIAWLKRKTFWTLKLEFSPGLLVSQGANPEEFLAYLLHEFECAELPKRIPYKSSGLDSLFASPLDITDVPPFIRQIRNRSGNTLNGVDLILRPFPRSTMANNKVN
jgi:FkbM family methyltransferase